MDLQEERVNLAGPRFLDLYAIAHEQYRVKRSIDAVNAGTPAQIGAIGEPLSGPRFSDVRSTMDRMQQQQADDRLALSLKMKEEGWGTNDSSRRLARSGP